MRQEMTSVAADGPVSTLVYRSRAVRSLRSEELFGLVTLARERNRAEHLTGLVVYDNAAFFQWLEGPAENLDRVMASIGRDGRHTDIEIVERRAVTERIFPQWDMRLGLRDHGRAAWPADLLRAQGQVMRDLRGTLPEVSSTLRSLAASARPGGASRTVELLRAIVQAQVVPELAERHLAAGRETPAQAQTLELARLVLGHASDVGATAALFGQVAATAVAEDRYPIIRLVEAAARRLGDLSEAGTCSGFDVDIGLSRLLSAARGAGGMMPLLPDPAAPRILIACAPGEGHLLGAAMASDELWDAGWAPRCEFPASVAALMDLLAGSWFDVVTLWLSPAFCREERLAPLAAAIAAARRASRNPHLFVLVGGRAFAHSTATDVGADLHRATAAGLHQAILRSTARAISVPLRGDDRRAAGRALAECGILQHAGAGPQGEGLALRR
ncbi:BLUF domain-containing protein [Roseicella frigidaeris]|uniref:BLUF domain-containing protein n=1 Tax=Roseicella frigidaeris TaxID=2230885 RepID=UPI001402F7D5|nr:BLUF domain-containing protein [Roseicella frigidaeris]